MFTAINWKSAFLKEKMLFGNQRGDDLVDVPTPNRKHQMLLHY
jgi:hypothetical protein